MRCTLILSNLTYPPTQGLHGQAVEMIRFLAEDCDELQVFIYCKEVELLDESALIRELPGSPTVTVIPYSGSDLRRGLANRFFGTARSTESRIVAETERFSPDFVHLDMAVAAGLHRALRSFPGVISWMDPGSRRQIRLAFSSQGLDRLPHFAAGFVYYVFEMFCRSRNKVWHVVSPTDRIYMMRAHRGQPVVQIPVSITAEDAYLGGSDSDRQLPSHRNRKISALIFLDLRVPHLYSSFELLVTRCLQPLHSTGFVIHYTVLGRVEDDGRLANLCTGLDIEFLLWVDDLSETLRTVDFVILPDQVGTGLKTRAVRVLAAGCAVIGTKYAFEGIAVDPGTHALVAQSWMDWQAGVRRLATDAQLRGHLLRSSPIASAPFETVVVFERWKSVYAGIVEGRDF